MNLRFLLDTNILSEPLRSIPNSNVIEMLRRHENEIATATIVYHELLFGCYRLPESKKRKTIEFFTPFYLIQLTLLNHNTNLYYTENKNLKKVNL
ncbi:hypothetical protein [Halotia branconii]|uniref:PIN domain-containing protein n=1 Tax=Halotia branconii CENA392 TaxID=1539056 RepID=A0AAJ6NY01_9CYAN|nr:hypothetical protein [Halotia branconii]WGV28473.1 hypothetical protein QI031_13810 [Halotia branconii CENA392]